MPAKINPTRIELIRLRAKLKMMENGHALLKKKRDGLMKEFIGIIHETKNLREKINKEAPIAFKFFLYTSGEMRNKEVEEALAVSTKEIALEVGKKNIMGVETPIFKIEEKGDFFCYSPFSTNVNLDFTLSVFSKILKDAVKLAEFQKTASSLAGEIEKTRREVNALEYIYIPNIKKTVKYIFSKLDERERLSSIILMKSKERIVSA